MFRRLRSTLRRQHWRDRHPGRLARRKPAPQEIVHPPLGQEQAGKASVMVPSGRGLDKVPVTPELDPDSARWLQALADRGPQRESAPAELHAMLAIMQKIGQFRGESRFTTWAYKFVVFEVSAKIGRHFWRNPARSPDAEDWDRLPDRFGFDPARESEWRDLLGAVRRAVETELTPRQREVFVAIVLNDVPLDALVVKLGSNRDAIYKTMFDARRKLRAALAANGYLNDEKSRRS